MKGYVTRKGNCYYAVIYEGTDPITGRDRRRWYPAAHDSALLILVSNNPYGFDPRPQFRTRGTLDHGVLGVITVPGPPHGPEEWSTPRFRVDSATSVAVGIDGESADMSPPLLFECDRQALRVRLPTRRT